MGCLSLLLEQIDLQDNHALHEVTTLVTFVYQ